MLERELINVIETVINQKVTSIKQVNFGFNRTVYLINDEYILKIVKDPEIEAKTKNEVLFLSTSSLEYNPSLVCFDFSKTIVPYAYYLEKKSRGESLLYQYPDLSKEEKEKILDDLLDKMKSLHSSISNFFQTEDSLEKLLIEYDKYLERLIKSNIFPADKIKHLDKIRSVIPQLFQNSRQGLIHGDLHFNNILLTEDHKLQLIDFETVNYSFVESEFDSINRMQRNPNSFNPDSNTKLSPRDFEGIIEYLKEHSEEIDKDTFDSIILFYDCLNSIKWIYKYPNHQVYNDVLFNRSRKLL